MKAFITELTILFLVYAVGVGIGGITPIPSSLASMGMLFLCLQLKWIKEEHLAKITPLILLHIALFFIAPAIGIVNSLETLRGSTLKIIVVLVLSNMVVMGVTGFVVQKLLQRRNHADNR